MMNLYRVAQGRRLRPVSLGLLAALLLGACAATPQASSSSAPDTGARVRLGLVLPDLSNETIGEVYEGAKAAAGAANVDIMQGGATDTAQWVSAKEKIKKKAK